MIAVRKQHEAEYQTAQALQAQAGLLTEVASERLKGGDVASAQGIILEVLTSRGSKGVRSPAAISAFQEIWAADSRLAVLTGHRDIVWSAAYSPDGNRIVTASVDNTARIWDARASAGLDALIAWSQSALFDPLAEIERAQLGLNPDPLVRKWSGQASACDEAAAAIHDPNRRASGVARTSIAADSGLSPNSAGRSMLRQRAPGKGRKRNS